MSSPGIHQVHAEMLKADAILFIFIVCLYRFTLSQFGYRQIYCYSNFADHLSFVNLK